MTLKEQVKQMLQDIPESRERKNRYRSVWHILQIRYNVDYVLINKAKFLEIASEIESISRCIRQFQQYEPDLRGMDYDEKDILEQKKEIELGYCPGHFQDIKLLNKIAPQNE
jgi:hypothetical protein